MSASDSAFELMGEDAHFVRAIEDLAIRFKVHEIKSYLHMRLYGHTIQESRRRSGLSAFEILAVEESGVLRDLIDVTELLATPFSGRETGEPDRGHGSPAVGANPPEETAGRSTKEANDNKRTVSKNARHDASGHIDIDRYRH